MTVQRVAIRKDGYYLVFEDGELISVKPLDEDEPDNGGEVKTISTHETPPSVERDDNLSALKLLDGVAFNAAAEKLAIEKLDVMIEHFGGGVEMTMYRAELAYSLDISIETAKRYIAKFTAWSAPYQLVAGTISRKERNGD